MGTIETVERPDVSKEQMQALEATFAAISTVQVQAFVNDYRLYPGGEADTVAPVTSL